MIDFSTFVKELENAADEVNKLYAENNTLKTRVAELEASTGNNGIVGYVYILTNPTMPGLVKIGYADDVPVRMKQLYNTSVAAPFECYAIYGVENRLPDKSLHSLIDSLDPDLRMTENREYYRMSPERAYNILGAIARINARECNLIFDPYGVKAEEKTVEDTVVNEDDEDYRFRPLKGFVFNGKTYYCKGYAEALRILAKALYAENPAVIDSVIDKTGCSVRFSSGPIIYGKYRYRTHKFDDNHNIYIYDSFDANGCVKHCYSLIKMYGYDENTLSFVNESEE